MRKEVKINMDNLHRVSLTRLLTKEERHLVSSFKAYKEDDGRIILEPLVEIPAKEHWIYKNPEALDSLMRGIKDVEEGRLNDLGSFAKYATEDGEDED
jgi:hypothetical protein